MKRSNFKKVSMFKNKKGYWQKGGGSESELKLALVCLIIACLSVALGIIVRL